MEPMLPPLLPMLGVSFNAEDLDGLERWNAEARRWGLAVLVVPGADPEEPEEMALVGRVGDPEWFVYRVAGSGQLRIDCPEGGGFVGLVDTIDEARGFTAAAWSERA